MKRLLLLSSLALLGLVAGCESSSALNQMHLGMTKQEVISLLGTPDSTSAQANVEYLTYYLEVNTQNGPVRDEPYFVRLLNGRVESFGRYRVLDDLYLRPVTNAQPGQPDFPQSALLGAPMMTPPVSQAAAAPQGTDLATELTRLKALKDQGVLTEEEFQKAKKKLLAEQP